MSTHRADTPGHAVQAEPTTPAAASGQARPKTPDAKAASSNSSLVQCFGMGRTLDDAAEKEEAPPGVVGLRNLGKLTPLPVPSVAAADLAAAVCSCSPRQLTQLVNRNWLP